MENKDNMFLNDKFTSRNIKVLILLLVLISTLSIVTRCKNTSEGRDALKVGLSVTRGHRDASDARFADLEGNTHTLSEYKGKVIVLNLWATWCIHCNIEMSAFQKMYKHYKNSKDFIFIAMNTEFGQITDKQIKAHIDKGNYTFFTGIDRYGEVSRQYGVGSLPVTYIIDKDFSITGRVIGSTDWSSPIYYRIIDRLIEKEN